MFGSIKAGYYRRFSRFFNKYDEQCIAATIAAVTHPHFKTRWIHEDFQSAIEIEYIRELLIRDCLAIPHLDNNNNETYSKSTPESKKDKKRFQYRFSTANTNTSYQQNSLQRESAMRVEVSTWLGLPDTDDENDLSMLKGHDFPNIRQLFIKYNTIISSSAPVERLFSFASEYL